VNRLPCGPAVILIAVAFATAIATAGEYPFVGKWDCDAAIFAFTNRSYNNGGQTIEFNRIDFGKRDFKLSFKDGYAISLLNVTGKTMRRRSWATGDIFDCKRIR